MMLFTLELIVDNAVLFILQVGPKFPLVQIQFVYNSLQLPRFTHVFVRHV